MRRTPSSVLALSFALALGACSSAPPPPPIPAPAARPAAQRPSRIEITGTKERAVITERGADGAARFEVKLDAVYAVRAAPGGGAFVVTPAAKKAGKARAIRLDGSGHEAWSTEIDAGPDTRLFFVFEELWVKSGPARRALALDPITGKNKGERTIDKGAGPAAPKGSSAASAQTGPSALAAEGDVLVLSEADAVVRRTVTGEEAWRVRLQPFPVVSDVARDGKRSVAVSADGTVLTGAFDGSLVALDRDGRGLFQMGVRGPIDRIDATPEGDFVVRGAGLATVIRPQAASGARGVIVREGPSSGEPLIVDGVLDKRGPGPQDDDDPNLVPEALDVRVELVTSENKPFQSVTGVVARSASDVWILGRREGQKDAAPHLFHFDGKTWSDEGSAAREHPKETFVKGKPAAKSAFVPSTLAVSPSGQVHVMGLRVGGGLRRVAVLVRDGRDLREPKEWAAQLATAPVEIYGDTAHAMSAGGTELVCMHRPDKCFVRRGGGAVEPFPYEEGRTMTDVPGVPNDMSATLARMFAGETVWRAQGAASGENNVWGVAWDHLASWDGKEEGGIGVPIGHPSSVWVAGPEDLWVTGDRGLGHYVKGAWTFVTRRSGRVTGSAAGDVWLHGDTLWHITPNPTKKPDLQAKIALPPPAAPPSTPLAVAGKESGYRLERVAIQVEGQRPLRTAIDAEVRADGRVWLHEGPRIIEIDGDRGRAVYTQPAPPPFVCWYAPEPDCNLCASCNDRRPRPLPCADCLAPLAESTGFAILDDGLQGIRADEAAPSPVPRIFTAAIAASRSGNLWSVSADLRREPGLLVQGPAITQRVLGLPLAAYTAIAAQADDDVWIAGALSRDMENARAEGEGTLAHFDGETFTRHRGPEGPLLSVAVVGPNEAWAAGVAGGVLHVTANQTTAHHLVGEDNKPLRVVLRRVATSGAKEVWLAGDGATLLRFDGQTLRRIDASAAGSTAAFAGIVPPSGDKPGWLVGPSGIWKIVRAP